MLDDNFKVITYKQGYVDFKPSDEVDGTIISELMLGRDGVVVKLANREKAMDFLTKHFDMLSEGDKKRLQEEKLKADITRTKAEIEKLSSDNYEGPIEIIIKRREKTNG